eukprot:364429-Chlamydomonas_euryale.AAC.8
MLCQCHNSRSINPTLAYVPPLGPDARAPIPRPPHTAQAYTHATMPMYQPRQFCGPHLGGGPLSTSQMHTYAPMHMYQPRGFRCPSPLSTG